MEDNKGIQKLLSKRTALVEALLSVLERKVKSAQTELLRGVVDGFVDKLELTEDGRVKNTLYNKRLLSTVDNIFTKFGKTQGVEIATTVALGVQSIVDFGGEYYKTFTTKAKLLSILPNVQESMRSWLGLNEKSQAEPNGYLDKLIKDTTVSNQVKNFSLRAVIGQQGWRQTKDELKLMIAGEGEKTGALDKYYRNFVYDLYSQVDRATSQVFADKLGFRFYIYEGGIIETSRTFCRDKNGKVFHISEIQNWELTVARPPGYNPFTDCGGYGCRHHLNGIPDSVAYAMRPDAKGKFDNAAAAPVDTPPAEKPKPAPAAPKAKPAPKPAKAPKVEPVDTAPQEPVFVKDIQGAKNIAETKLKFIHAIRDAIPPGFNTKLSVSSALSLDVFKQYATQVAKLFNDYTINFPIEQISFKSKSSAYGYVQNYMNGEIATANFGDRVDVKRGMTEPISANRLTTQGKSRVDPENVQVATATHEFAHVLGTDTRYSKTFFDELKELRKQYHKELNEKINSGDIDGAAEIYLGRYAGTNPDEFWAEAFTEYKLHSKPSKYAKLAGALGDKHFKK